MKGIIKEKTMRTLKQKIAAATFGVKDKALAEKKARDIRKLVYKGARKEENRD